MKRTFSVAALTLAALLATLLTLSTAAPASAAVMGETRAGRYYLSVVCPNNAAEASFDKKVWKGRATIPYREVRRRLPELRRLAKKVSAANSAFARGLFNPPADWPDEVDELVDNLANKYVTRATRRGRQGSAKNAEAWIYWNNMTNKVDTGSLGERIRAKLDLPPPGEGC